MTNQLALRKGTVNVINDELKYFLLLGIAFEGGMLDVCVDHDEIVLALPGQGLLNVFQIGWQVFQHDFPAFASILRWNTVPSQLF